MVLHNELHDKALLQDGAVEHLSLYGELHLEPLAVGLSPDEASINKLHFLQSGQSSQREKQMVQSEGNTKKTE